MSRFFFWYPPPGKMCKYASYMMCLVDDVQEVEEMDTSNCAWCQIVRANENKMTRSYFDEISHQNASMSINQTYTEIIQYNHLRPPVQMKPYTRTWTCAFNIHHKKRNVNKSLRTLTNNETFWIFKRTITYTSI